MTEKLYYNDENLIDFTANILELEKEEKYWKTVLDKTCFYPEGGGQPADHGFIGRAKVVDVQKKEDKIFHYTREKPEEGKVECKVNWERRFDFMQQHTGQHILSGSLMKVGNFATVSVHLGDSFSTIEIDTDNISDKQIDQVEDLANDIINRNIPIISQWTDKEGLSKIKLRRPTKLESNIRLIQIQDFDCVACGGVHLSSTGKTGLIKYIGKEMIRGRCRLSWKIGIRAREDYRQKTKILNKLGQMFSSHQNDITSKIEKLERDYYEIIKQKNKLETEIAAITANQLLEHKMVTDNNNYIITHLFKSKDNQFIKKVMEQLTKEKQLLACLINQNDKQLNWIIGHSSDFNLEIHNKIKPLLEIIEGKGGGKPPIWQGMGKNADKVDDFFTKIRELG